MTNLQDLRRFSDHLPKTGTDAVMPMFFIGHGSPMNGIEQNGFSASWQRLGQVLEKPTAVLVISAHWLTNGTHVTAMAQPKTIHDFGGFPQALFEVEYPAPGAPSIARTIQEMIPSKKVGLDHEWGLDHGAWSVLRHIFPEAEVPVLQLSIDYHKPAIYHYELAKELQNLRNKGVLIIGSGNMIHNLRLIAWDKFDIPGYGYDWAEEINTLFKDKIERGDHESLIRYDRLGQAAKLAIPTPDHYFPLIYALGLRRPDEPSFFFNDELVGGSLNMLSVMFGKDLFLPNEISNR